MMGTKKISSKTKNKQNERENAMVRGFGSVAGKRTVCVIGHKNPDTDSICSAIAYAYLKNQISDEPHEARRAGHINKETKFVLKYFGVRKPRMSVDAAPAIGNIDIREEPGIDGENRM